VEGVLTDGGRATGGGRAGRACSGGGGGAPGPPFPVPVAAVSLRAGLEASPSEARFPAAGGGGGSSSEGGTGAYSSVSDGLAWGRLRAEGSTTRAMRAATPRASRGGHFRAHHGLLPRPSGLGSSIANDRAP